MFNDSSPAKGQEYTLDEVAIVRLDAGVDLLATCASRDGLVFIGVSSSNGDILVYRRVDVDSSFTLDQTIVPEFNSYYDLYFYNRAKLACSADGSVLFASHPDDRGSSGAVYCYDYTTSYGTPERLMADTTLLSPKWFGYDIDCDRSGNTLAVIERDGYGNNNFNDAAYKFIRSGGVWTQQWRHEIFYSWSFLDEVTINQSGEIYAAGAHLWRFSSNNDLSLVSSEGMFYLMKSRGDDWVVYRDHDSGNGDTIKVMRDGYSTNTPDVGPQASSDGSYLSIGTAIDTYTMATNILTPVVRSTKMAQKYHAFNGDKVLYVDGGTVRSWPHTITNARV